MDEELYDEFGNYIGPALEEEEQVYGQVEEQWGQYDEYQQYQQYEDTSMGDQSHLVPANMELDQLQAAVVDYDPSRARDIILPQDKEYFASAEELYPDVEILVQEEDTQPLSEPIISSGKGKDFLCLEKEIPTTSFDPRFMAGLMDHPTFTRHVSVLGHFHHGKTSFLDMLVQHTHRKEKWTSNDRTLRYTDYRVDEQARELSIKATPISLVLQDLHDKSHLITLVDAPGHQDFSTEVTAAVRLTDAAVVVVDAIEGVCMGTEHAIGEALRGGLQIVLCINKLDRLVVEAQLPPRDAYRKLVLLVEQVNAHIQMQQLALGLDQKPPQVSPLDDSVIFASSTHGWAFTLRSFAHMYSQAHGGIDENRLARRLWGAVYYHPDTRSFKTSPVAKGQPCTFLEFILEPLYKVYAHTLGNDAQDLADVAADMGVMVTPAELRMDAVALLTLVLKRLFGNSVDAIADAIVRATPSPLTASARKAALCYAGPRTGAVWQGMSFCDAAAPLCAHVVGSYPREDGSGFDSLVRVLSGCARPGMKVRVLGERYAEDTEQMQVCEVQQLWVLQGGRYRIEVNRVPAGSLCLMSGVDHAVLGTATVVPLEGVEAVGAFAPLRVLNPAHLTIAVEPLVPSQLPRMIEALRCVCKSYPGVRARVEESGEHVIVGTGELQLDCVLHDLRTVYANVEVRVSDPCVDFCESISAGSELPCFAHTSNQRNKITMLAEPLERDIVQDVDAGLLSFNNDTPEQRQEREHRLAKTYGWDLLAARSVWAFGPDAVSPNVLCDDTLPGTCSKEALLACRDGIVDGFAWAMREGPLCEQPVRGVKVRLVGAELADEPLLRARKHLIPTARRAAYASMLVASPRLEEPVQRVEIICPADCVEVVNKVLSTRRGHIISRDPKAGTPLLQLVAYVPLLECCGMETDIRVNTQGMAHIMTCFAKWETVPGDPLDKDIVIRPLEVAPLNSLARDFLLKTRRRKGLSEDVDVNRYFDEDMLLALAQHMAQDDM